MDTKNQSNFVKVFVIKEKKKFLDMHFRKIIASSTIKIQAPPRMAPKK